MYLSVSERLILRICVREENECDGLAAHHLLASLHQQYDAGILHDFHQTASNSGIRQPCRDEGERKGPKGGQIRPLHSISNQMTTTTVALFSNDHHRSHLLLEHRAQFFRPSRAATRTLRSGCCRDWRSRGRHPISKGSPGLWRTMSMIQIPVKTHLYSGSL